MKKKIAFVVATPKSAEAFLMNHFERLVKEYDVTLVANYPKEYDFSKFHQMGINCVKAPIERQISILKDFKALFALRRIFKNGKFASVHSVTPKAGLLTAVASWMAGIKIRIHIFTGQVWATRKGVMRAILKMMDKVIATLDNHILVDGEGQRQFLIREGVVKETESSVLANGSICGVKLEKFNISAEVRKREREQLGLKKADVVYIFLGRLNHEKGIGELFEAFNWLAPECPNAKLVLYGRDEEGYDQETDGYANIKRNQNFFYPGVTQTPFDALQAGDVFVLPTWREGFGVSVIEAQALGLPVITSDAYGVVNASVDGETGLRCKVNDPEGLYQCMKKYYDHPEMRKQHGAAGRKRVLSLFDSNIVCDAWMQFYIGLLG